MDIEQKVLLLAIYKKDSCESLNDVVLKVSQTATFDIKKGKSLLKDFKNKKYIIDGKLSFLGLELAKKIEKEFKV